jgi:Family of unknown function (DUF5681)
MSVNNAGKKLRGNPGIVEAGVATRFTPGQSGNPGGRPRRTPYGDAHRLVAYLLVVELQDSPNDTVAIRMAKRVARQGLEGKFAAVVEAANRTEGKPREMESDQDSEQIMDWPTCYRKIREAYGLEDDFEERNAKSLLTNDEGDYPEDAATNSPADPPKEGQE